MVMSVSTAFFLMLRCLADREGDWEVLVLLGFVLEQGPHEVGARLPVLLSFSLCSVKVHSLILGNWVDFLFVCFVGFCVWFLVVWGLFF